MANHRAHGSFELGNSDSLKDHRLFLVNFGFAGNFEQLQREPLSSRADLAGAAGYAPLQIATRSDEPTTLVAVGVRSDCLPGQQDSGSLR